MGAARMTLRLHPATPTRRHRVLRTRIGRLWLFVESSHTLTSPSRFCISGDFLLRRSDRRPRPSIGLGILEHFGGVAAFRSASVAMWLGSPAPPSVAPNSRRLGTCERIGVRAHPRCLRRGADSTTSSTGCDIFHDHDVHHGRTPLILTEHLRVNARPK